MPQNNQSEPNFLDSLITSLLTTVVVLFIVSVILYPDLLDEVFTSTEQIFSKTMKFIDKVALNYLQLRGNTMSAEEATDGNTSSARTEQ